MGCSCGAGRGRAGHRAQGTGPSKAGARFSWDRGRPARRLRCASGSDGRPGHQATRSSWDRGRPARRLRCSSGSDRRPSHQPCASPGTAGVPPAGSGVAQVPMAVQAISLAPLLGPRASRPQAVVHLRFRWPSKPSGHVLLLGPRASRPQAAVCLRFRWPSTSSGCYSQGRAGAWAGRPSRQAMARRTLR